MSVNEHIKRYIREHGLKQLAVATLSGIPYKTFNSMMNGKRKIYVDEYCSICKALEVSPLSFINGWEV